jgi:hypothetical protein
MYEQLDQFYYINDIFHLNIEKLNNLLFDNYMEIIFKYFIDSLTYIPSQHQVTPMVKIVQRQTMTPNFIPLKKENYECIIPKKFTEQSEQEEKEEEEEEKENEKKTQETIEEEKNSMEQVLSEENPFESNEQVLVDKQEENNPFEQEEEKTPFEQDPLEKEKNPFEETETKVESDSSIPEKNETLLETVTPNNEETEEENEETNDKPVLPPLEIEDVRNEVIEEKTPPTTPKKTYLNPVETEYLSHKLSLYLLSHSIQTFDHQLLVNKIMKVILDESFLNLIHSQLRTGNDSLIYTGICLLNSLSNHKSNSHSNLNKI